MKNVQKFAVKGNVVLCGAGSIGKGCLPLIRRHIDIGGDLIVVEQKKDGRTISEKYGAEYVEKSISEENHKELLGKYLTEGSFLMNMTNDVRSADLIALCSKKKSFYIDTCTEPWLGYYRDPKNQGERSTNYFFRKDLLDLRKQLGSDDITAVACVGANPGLASILVKQALMNISKDVGHSDKEPQTKEEWAQLACDLNIHGIHVAERDFQTMSQKRKKNTFYNTWSVSGFINEGIQPCELGWGTKENWMPPTAKGFTFGSKCAIYLDRPGMMTRVRSWTPLEGPYLGYLITHNESISLSDYFSVKKNGEVVYRPTAFYAYHPSNEAMISLNEFTGRAFQENMEERLMLEEIDDGIDELGVLLYGHKKNAYWFGSRLSIHDTRKRIEEQNATSLQVTSTVLSAMKWAIENPKRGIVEAEDLDYKDILKFVEPYVSPLVGEYTDWTPVKDVPHTYVEPLDPQHPWSFYNCLYNKPNKP